jgi:hypothetical protein
MPMNSERILILLLITIIFVNYSQAESIEADANNKIVEQTNKKTDKQANKRTVEQSKVKNLDQLIPISGKILKDISYGPSAEQMLDIYLPNGKVRPQVFFLVNGEGWEQNDRKSKKSIENKIQRWVPKGYIVISVGYRLLPGANPLTQANDIASALTFSQQKVQEWGGDASQFILIGHSTGAHLVSLISAAISDPKLSSVSEKNLRDELDEQLNVQFKPVLVTIALENSVFNTSALMIQSHEAQIDRAMGADPKFWERVSPYHQLKGKVSPFYLVCSSKQDKYCSQGEDFIKKIKSFGGHGEISKIDLSFTELNEQLGINGNYTDQVEKFLKNIGVKL